MIRYKILINSKYIFTEIANEEIKLDITYSAFNIFVDVKITNDSELFSLNHRSHLTHFVLIPFTWLQVIFSNKIE